MSGAVDLAKVAHLLQAAMAKCQQLHGQPLADESRNRDLERDRVRALAEVQRQLLYLAHLGDKIRVATLDEYHAVRGLSHH